MNSQDSNTYKEYCKLRNQIRNLTRKAQIDKERKVSREAKTNPKIFWNFVNSKTKTKPGIPNLQKSQDKNDLTVNDKEKAETLLNYFSTVFTNEPLDDNIPTLDPKDVNTKLNDINISEEFIMKKLKSLKTSKSPGPDKIHPRILKELSDT